MASRQLELIIEGHDAQAAADELAAEVEGFGEEAKARSVEPDQASEVARRAIDPVSVAALILAVPGTILAVMDIADRIKKRRRATRLLERAQQIRVARKVEIQVVTKDGAKTLDGLTPDDLLDLADQVSSQR